MLREDVIGPGRVWRLVVLAAGVVLLAACGSTAGGRPGPTPTAPATTPPAAGFQALAIKGLKGSNTGIDLYDSVARAWRSIPTGPNPNLPLFAGPNRVAYLTAGGIVTQNMDGSDRRTEVSGNVMDHAWSVDGTLAYVTPVPPLNERSMLTIRLPNGRTATADIGASSGIGGVTPQRKLEFSPDGRVLLLVEPNVADPYLQVRALDGSLRLAPASSPFVRGGGATWITGGLFSFSGSGEMRVTDPATGVERTLLSGVHAWNPAASPDRRYVAYEQRDPQPDRFGGFGPARLQLFDLTSGKVVEGFSREDGVLARFVSGTEFWFSAGSDGTPAIVRYDLVTRAEAPMGMTGYVTDVRRGSAG